MRKWQRDVARRFDGEAEASGREAAPGGDAAAYEAALHMLREGAQAAVQRPEIADAQFPAFMQGIRENLETPAKGHRGFWALASLSMAALLVAISAFLVFSGDKKDSPNVVQAVSTQVEAASSEISGATVEKYTNDDGTAVVWVSTAKRDLL